MKIGEVCLLTNDVRRLAAFYKRLLDTENGSDDEVWQAIIAEETSLTIYNDGTEKPNNNRNICIAFTVGDIEKEYRKVLAMDAEIIEKPTARPWGAVEYELLRPRREYGVSQEFWGEITGSGNGKGIGKPNLYCY